MCMWLATLGCHRLCNMVSMVCATSQSAYSHDVTSCCKVAVCITGLLIQLDTPPSLGNLVHRNEYWCQSLVLFITFWRHWTRLGNCSLAVYQLYQLKLYQWLIVTPNRFNINNRYDADNELAYLFLDLHCLCVLKVLHVLYLQCSKRLVLTTQVSLQSE